MHRPTTPVCTSGRETATPSLVTTVVATAASAWDRRQRPVIIGAKTFTAGRKWQWIEPATAPSPGESAPYPCRDRTRLGIVHVQSA